MWMQTRTKLTDMRERRTDACDANKTTIAVPTGSPQSSAAQHSLSCFFHNVGECICAAHLTHDARAATMRAAITANTTHRDWIVNVRTTADLDARAARTCLAKCSFGQQAEVPE